MGRFQELTEQGFDFTNYWKLCDQVEDPILICANCYSALRHNKQRWCKNCINEYRRRTNKRIDELTEEQKQKIRCRDITRMNQRRGKIKPMTCIFCGEKAEKHHPDYARPLLIIWVCREHHLFIERL